MYKPGGTIAAALGRIQQTNYVLPAIQREFVWKPEQIEKLFDSLMQGYPFGTFLLWKIEPQISGNFRFYDFVLNYHQRDAAHCPELPVLHHQSVTAVLDGQQRLTALNIGLRGSMAVKEAKKWWNNPDAFPKRTLRLNLLADGQPDEDGVVYEFKFLTDDQAERGPGKLWFKVPQVLGMKGGPEMVVWLTSQGLAGDELNRAYAILDRLHRVVHNEPLIHYYEEEAQDIERVLNIFIRLNSGGTVLSYSDLLLSIAVAQWQHIDARSEVHSLVDELNRIGAGFSLSQDFVLKAGLMLADIASVGFKVENFTRENMRVLEANWQGIRAALVRTVELASSFGFNGQSLRADSALLPIAYYLYKLSAPDNYVTSRHYADDREKIRRWLVRSLVKSGVWGSGLDSLLTALRETMKEHGAEAFPEIELYRKMASRGKGLEFSDAEIDELLGLEYGERRIFPLLSLLFPFVDLRNQFHVDHVFPFSRFGIASLKNADYTQEDAERLRTRANQLPNLQLLEGLINIEKQAALPAAWLAARYEMPSDRNHYCSVHLLGTVPETLKECEAFWDSRKEALRDRLKAMLGRNPEEDGS